MARGIGHHSGKILGVFGVLKNHWDAIDYDLLSLGLDLNDLGTERLDWRRLAAILSYLPHTSALAKSVHGEAASWGDTEHLLAAAVDALNAANWQRQGKGPKPKPIPRPRDSGPKVKGVPLSEAQAVFARHNPTAFTAWKPPAPSCAAGDCDRTDLKAKGLCGRCYQRMRRSVRRGDVAPSTAG